MNKSSKKCFKEALKPEIFLNENDLKYFFIYKTIFLACFFWINGRIGIENYQFQ